MQETIVNTERHINMRGYQADGLFFNFTQGLRRVWRLVSTRAFSLCDPGSIPAGRM